MSDAPVPQPGDWSGRRSQASYQKGSEGERRFGLRLNDAAGERGGCWVSHSLVLPGQQRDIDHLVVGPAGVTVIDTKAYDGRVWIGRLGLGRGRRAFPHEIDGVSRQINRVYSTLARAGRDDVHVTGIICMVNENPGIPAAALADVRGVKIGRPRAVIRHALRDGPLDRTTVDSIQWLLESAFTIHGGSQVPSHRIARRIPPAPGRTWRWPRRAARAGAGFAVLLVAAAALAHIVPRAVHSIAKPYRDFSRADLQRQLPELGRVAARQAHGRVHGPRLQTTRADFVLTYRRGKHCRVTVLVARLPPAFGGGRRTVTSTDCRRRR